jgi:hypothetical protein
MMSQLFSAVIEDRDYKVKILIKKENLQLNYQSKYLNFKIHEYPYHIRLRGGA